MLDNGEDELMSVSLYPLYLSLPSSVCCANIRRNLHDQQNTFLSAALLKTKGPELHANTAVSQDI